MRRFYLTDTVMILAMVMAAGNADILRADSWYPVKNAEQIYNNLGRKMIVVCPSEGVVMSTVDSLRVADSEYHVREPRPLQITNIYHIEEIPDDAQFVTVLRKADAFNKQSYFLFDYNDQNMYFRHTTPEKIKYHEDCMVQNTIYAYNFLQEGTGFGNAGNAFPSLQFFDRGNNVDIRYRYGTEGGSTYSDSWYGTLEVVNINREISDSDDGIYLIYQRDKGYFSFYNMRSLRSEGKPTFATDETAQCVENKYSRVRLYMEDIDPITLYLGEEKIEGDMVSLKQGDVLSVVQPEYYKDIYTSFSVERKSAYAADESSAETSALMETEDEETIPGEVETFPEDAGTFPGEVKFDEPGLWDITLTATSNRGVADNEYPALRKTIRVNVTDIMTGVAVDTADSEKASTPEYYDLHGRRMQACTAAQLPQGIYLECRGCERRKLMIAR